MSRKRTIHFTAVAVVAMAIAFTTAVLSAHEVKLQPPPFLDRADPTPVVVNDSSDVAAVVKQFHDALAAGDSTGALKLLSDDVVIHESGGVETRDDYRSHHLPADIGFARAVPSERAPLSVRVKGDVAWVSGTSSTQGEYRGRQINSAGAELMVLTRESGGWKIRAIHWSSRTRRPPGG